MTKYKTLEQLWNERGDKTEIKVRCKERDDWRLIKGKAPFGGFYGYNNFGLAYAYNGDEEEWTLYEEPEELIDYWPAVLDRNKDPYCLSNKLFSSIDEARSYFSLEVLIVVRLATELPPIKLPRRKKRC